MAQGDYGMRGAAAMRLLKGGKKSPPPEEEDDLGLPPEDVAAQENQPVDLAAMLGGGAPPDAPLEEASAPMPEEGGGAPDFESAIAGVEAALEEMPPEVAEEIRVHLNAAREIAARGNVEAMAQQPLTSPGEVPEPPATVPGEKEIGG